MVKETAIKVSREFKEFLVANKKGVEDFEETIKRLVNQLIKPVYSVNPKQLTKESIRNKKQPIELKPIYRKEIKNPKTETIPEDAQLIIGRTKSGGAIKSMNSHLGTVE